MIYEFANSVSDGIDPGDCAVLVDIDNALAPLDWLASDAPCSWPGVVCNSASPKRVTQIDIQLIATTSGALPASIGNLTELTRLDTTLAGITGVPPEIGTLSNLVFLDLAYSQMTSLPSEIGNLTNLQSLFLGNGGAVDVFQIPTWIGNLMNLRALGLYDGGFYGEIPTQVCNLTLLEFLGLNTNHLSGAVPSCLTNLTQLQQFNIHNNPALTATDPVFCAFLFSIPDANWDSGVCPPPATPSNLSAVGISWTQIDLSWNDNSSDETNFRIERSPNGVNSWTEIANVPADQASYQHTSLTCSTTNFYRVRAYRVSDGQFSAYSNVATGRTHLCSSPGAAPARTYFTASTPTLTWNRVSWATEYEIQVDSALTFTMPLNFTATVPSSTLEVTTTSLPDGTYYWHVRAKKPDGTWGAWSAIESFVVAAP